MNDAHYTVEQQLALLDAHQVDLLLDARALLAEMRRTVAGIGSVIDAAYPGADQMRTDLAAAAEKACANRVRLIAWLISAPVDEQCHAQDPDGGRLESPNTLHYSVLTSCDEGFLHMVTSGL